MQRITATRNANNEDAPTKTKPGAFSIARNTTCLSGHNASASLRPRYPPPHPRDDNLPLSTSYRSEKIRVATSSPFHAHRCSQQERVAKGLRVLLRASPQRRHDERAVHLPLAVGRRASPGAAIRVPDKFSSFKRREGRERLARGGDNPRRKTNLGCSFSPRCMVESLLSSLWKMCAPLYLVKQLLSQSARH